jgi:hypothetical protein
MAYITSRNNRFYVVAYDGIDPATGRQRNAADGTRPVVHSLMPKPLLRASTNARQCRYRAVVML